MKPPFSTLISPMRNLFNRIPLSILIVLSLTLGLAPFTPEPHLWEKLKMLASGELTELLDIFDLLLHGTPWLLLIIKLFLPPKSKPKDWNWSGVLGSSWRYSVWEADALLRRDEGELQLRWIRRLGGDQNSISPRVTRRVTVWKTDWTCRSNDYSRASHSGR